MMPKNAFQRHVLSLSKEIQPITAKQEKWAYDNCFEHYAKVQKKGTICLDCGYVLKGVQTPKDTDYVCPQCGRKLIVNNTKKLVFKDSAYFGITTTFKNHQLFRIFWLEVKFQTNKRPQYICKEVIQRWIAPDGKKVVISVPRAANFLYYDIWRWWENMEIRQGNHMAYFIEPQKIYPAVRYIPVIKRNGFKGNFHNIHPFHLFSLILGNHAAENFLKRGEIEWLQHAFRNSKIVLRCWSAIKIALRHKMEIKDKSLWLDYIDLLIYFGKDIHNPKVIFPADLRSSHDVLVRKKIKIETVKALERELQKPRELEEKYQKDKSHFFDVEFMDGEIQVNVLKSIADFKAEGSILKHCVYSNNYFQKKNSLVLSARVKNEPVETIEISLVDFTIIQSRGLKNTPTQYHDRIIKLVNYNMDTVKRASYRKQKR